MSPDPNSTQAPSQSAEALPTVGGAVLVTYFNGQHAIKTVIAHVLAFSVLDIERVTPEGLPAITVAFPDDAVDPVVLSSSNWYKAYKREAGVVHFSHKLAAEGKVSVVWGHPIAMADLPPLEKPAGDGKNPIFDRPPSHEPAQISAGQQRLEEERPLEEHISVQQAADNYNAALKQAT